VVKTVTVRGSVLAVFWLVLTAAANGQRIQFATPVQYGSPPATAPTVVAPPAAPPAYAVPAPPAYSPTMPPGNITYGTVPPPGAVTPAAPGAMTFGPAPMATLDGTIQPPPATWDPYAPPGTGATPAMLPQDPYLQPGQFQLGSPSAAIARMQRLLQEVRFDYHWFLGHGSNPNELGINDVEFSATFGWPLGGNAQTPLLITPGFAVHYWDGPKSVPLIPPPNAPDMPPQTFDAYLDAAWNPQVTPMFGGELDVRVGVYSDFKAWEEDSLRYIAKGAGVLTFSPSFKFKAGVWYLDRVRYKILPIGGIVWSPNPDIRFDILFPNPKFTQRLTTIGNTEWWWYVSGDYGGGSWMITRTSIPGDPRDQVDYNDMRVALGLEFKRLTGMGLNGLFEGGYAFQRELVYNGQHPPTFVPDGTFFLRAGLAY
jgi:hypothetical protein